MGRSGLNKKALLDRAGANGPVMILCATALMAFQDAMVKIMSADLPLWQLFLTRSMIALPALLILSREKSSTVLRAALAPWALLRSCLIVAMYVAFYAALPILDLSIVAACYYMGPIIIVLLSAIFLREPVRPGQIVAIGMAFCGVLIIVQPTGEAFSAAALIPLASALCYAIAAVVTRGYTSAAGPWALTVSVNIAFIVIGGTGIGVLKVFAPDPVYPFLMRIWVPLGNETFASLAVLAAISIGIHLALARAYQAGPMTAVASLDYSYLLFAALWAFILFGTVPESMIVAGTGLITAAGMWITLGYRKRRG
ncbi:DMT family transporter [Halomonas salipaludis]|uniref:EamA family transporter n=1 Tax=Halomonas salipaludis TaxID=2032625 RepID=A0A2A2EQS4_9GAMM|nr:DMT family transporter [Halomonas salipaludis]PAU75466.1 EamA family transporter [Halomonas salipaludis]